MATFKSESEAINALIAIEKKEEGYLEKASNKDLNSKTKNAGSANYTKYWRDLAKLGLMGQDKNFAGGPVWYWCAGFQTWSFIEAFGLTNAKKLLLHMPYISCANLGTLAKKAKRLYDKPKAGDIVLFYNGSRFSHTGLVYKVSSTYIFTIEGNTNNSKSVVPNGGAVCLKSYTISSCTKKGHKFFRPDYSIVTKAEPKKSGTSKKKVKINTINDNLRCRKTASSTGTIIGSFAKGSTVELKEKTNSKWWKVSGKSVNGTTITGYCAREYLKEI